MGCDIACDASSYNLAGDNVPASKCANPNKMKCSCGDKMRLPRKLKNLLPESMLLTCDRHQGALQMLCEVSQMRSDSSKSASRTPLAAWYPQQRSTNSASRAPKGALIEWVWLHICVTPSEFFSLNCSCCFCHLVPAAPERGAKASNGGAGQQSYLRTKDSHKRESCGSRNFLG